jgi:hypothetical protein
MACRAPSAVSLHRFTGTIDKLTFKLGPSQMTEAEQKAGAAAAAKATD